ncbi:MAG: hypothetical protein ACI4C7_10340 [Clostridia bacterium]
MNKGSERKSSTGSDKMTTLIIVVVIIAVLGLGVFATYGKIAKNVMDNKIANGEMPRTVEYAAEEAGMTVEEYLTQYGLENSADVNGETPVNDLYGYMTFEKYMTMANEGSEEPLDIDAVMEDWELTGKVTKDTLWKDVEPIIPVGKYFGEEQLAQYKQAYNLGDEVNEQTTYGDFQKIIEAKISELSSATAAPAADSDAAAEATAAPAE